MNSSSQSASASDKPPHLLADVVGTVIALLTLALPLFMIAHYSSSVELVQPITKTVLRTE